MAAVPPSSSHVILGPEAVVVIIITVVVVVVEHIDKHTHPHRNTHKRHVSFVLQIPMGYKPATVVTLSPAALSPVYRLSKQVARSSLVFV